MSNIPAPSPSMTAVNEEQSSAFLVEWATAEVLARHQR